MVLEYISLANLFLNDFFAGHILFISYLIAAIFIVIFQPTIDYRIISPIMDYIERIFFSNIPLLPNVLSTIFFIAWTGISIYVYEWIANFFLTKYKDHLTILIPIVFVIVAVTINIRYRD